MHCAFDPWSGVAGAAKRSGFVWLLAAVSLVGCGGGPDAVEVPDWDPEKIAAKVMSQLDSNQDGHVDETELQKSPGLLAAAKTLDQNRDGRLSKQEIIDRFTAYENSGTGLTAYDCVVVYKNKGLPGARLQLIPEDFLDGLIEPAEGVADARGMVQPITEGQKLPGVRMGIYRVKITSDDVQLPAKYNTKTTLGVEVAPGLSRGSAEPQRFDVSD